MGDKLCYPPPYPAITKQSSSLRRVTEQEGGGNSWNEGSYGTIPMYNRGQVRKRDGMTISLLTYLLCLLLENRADFIKGNYTQSMITHLNRHAVQTYIHTYTF